MTRIRRRELIDRKDLSRRLEACAKGDGAAPQKKAEILAILKDVLAHGKDVVRKGFEDGASGMDTVHAHSYLVDSLIQALFQYAETHVRAPEGKSEGKPYSIMAIGGYGRGELAPFSDVDLMFLLPKSSAPDVERVVEFTLYMLWDMGLKVGHSTRTIDDCVKLAREDLTIRTSMLESRLLFGDRPLFEAFRKRFDADVVAPSGPAFVEAKLAERDERHERMGDTRYLLEPHVKEGKGGLRDLQTLFWIAKYLYRAERVKDLVKQGVLTAADNRRFAKAANFLWTVRSHLHFLTGRAEERLVFNVQEEVGKRMGYGDRANLRGVERFMKHYFLVAKDVGDLTRILCAVLEEDHKKRRFRFPWLNFNKASVEGFKVDGARLDVASEDAFEKEPVKILKLFHEAQENDLDIHPHALRHVTQNLGLVNAELREDPEANRVFLEMLTSRKDPEVTLRRLNEAEVFGRFIPDFRRVVGQMQYDMYHVFTVDEHTIHAIGILHQIEMGTMTETHPVASKLIHELESRRALYVAVLLHDIAKGRGGDHSEDGAKIARKLCPRLGLNYWETATVEWLVRHHLLMSRTAFTRDVDNPKTIDDFVQVVQSPEWLRMLHVLTVTDIHAVGPTVWNEWKGNLLRELFYQASEAMAGRAPAEWRQGRIEASKRKLRETLAERGWDEAEIERHVALGYSDYWRAFDVEVHAQHAEMVRRAEANDAPLWVETHINKHREATDVVIYTADHPGLFARIAGTMALSGATILDAKIVTLANGMALDTFSIQDRATGTAYEDRNKLDRLWGRIEQSMSGEIHAARELNALRENALPSRTDVFTVAPHVVIDNQASAKHTVIEVNGRDRPCLLHDVTQTLTDLGLQIHSAHISTYGERVVDVFYVKDIFGLKVNHGDKLKSIRRRLEGAMDPGC